MDILKSNTDVSYVFSHGKHYGASGVTIIVCARKERHGLPGRVAFVAGKKSGNAVWRNAAKRRMRAVCRELNYTWQGQDIVFLAKRSILQLPYSRVLHTCSKLLDKAGFKACASL